MRAGPQYREESAGGESIALLLGAKPVPATKKAPAGSSTEITCTGGEPMSDFATADEPKPS